MLLVTALYEIKGGSLDFDTYLGHLEQLLSFDLPFWVYCDPDRRDQILARVPPGARVVVMGIPLNEFRTYASIMSAQPALPASDNPAKDSLPFLALVNTKLEFVLRAAAMQPEFPLVGFIDAGLAKVLRDLPLARRRLEALAGARLEGTLFPGIFEPRALESEAGSACVNWRFCGGFFAGHRDRLADLQVQCNGIIAELLARGRITWEVNVWALAEQRGADFGWYPADHDDRLLAWPGAPI